jgi:O-antigen ligase
LQLIHNISALKINVLNTVNTPARLTFWSACLLVVSMVLSPFLLSISMWGLVAAALWNVAAALQQEGRVATLKSATTWVHAVLRSFQNLWAHKNLAVMALLLLVPALSIFWSDDLGYWLRVTRVRLPFLILPWAFANLPKLNPRQHKQVLYLLLWFMVLACIGVGINFLLHYETIMNGLGRGQPIPVPRQHVRFSLVLATAIVSGAWLWQQGFYLKYLWERKALAIAVAFLFLFIHILSVRGGLAVLYAALITSIVWYVWQTKRWMAGMLVLGSLALLLWGAIETIPSLRQRVAYMKYDWERYKANDGEAYSDAERWVSLKVGYRIWEENPMFGTGSGDLMHEVKRVTTEQFPDYAKSPKLPHNQWIHIMASTGMLGLALSLAAFFIPVFYRKNRTNYLFTVFQIMVFITFIIECTVENAIGVSWYLFYTLWFAATVDD